MTREIEKRPAVDAVFLSFDEPAADGLFAHLQQVIGRPVRRLHGVSPMRRAYRLTAELVDSEFYLLADGDFEIDRGFDAAAATALPDGAAMRVWQAENAVNGLRYGYGGLKLVRTAAMRELGDGAVDVLADLPGRVDFAPIVAGRTRIDQSPFHAWKAGFRECAMLSRPDEYGHGTPQATAARIRTWTSGGDGEIGAWARRGASDGVAYATDHPQGLDVLNEPGWLRRRFAQVRL